MAKNAKPYGGRLSEILVCVLIVSVSLLTIYGGLGAFAEGLSLSFMGSAGSALTVLMAIELILGFAELVGAYWLWKRLMKGWTLIMVIEGLAIFFSFATIAVAGQTDYLRLVIAGIIVVYLLMKKSLFK